MSASAPRRRASGNRRPGAGRIALALVCVAVGIFALRDSLGSALAPGAPILAHSIAPWNGAILGRAAEYEFQAAPSIDKNGKAATMAREALRASAVDAGALNVLGLQAQLRRDDEMARRIFSYSLGVTRRELPPRLWEIENAVVAGDIGGALESYDIAIRTSRQAAPLLYPTLALALNEPLIRRRLVPLLGRGQEWAPDFINFASTMQRGDPRSVYRLLIEGAGKIPASRADHVAVINNLFYAGALVEARDLYRRTSGGSRQALLRDGSLEFPSDLASVFDWRILEEAIALPMRGGGIELSIPPTPETVLVQQALLLPPGRFRLASESTGIDAAPREAPFWRIECRDGKRLAALKLAPPMGSSGQGTVGAQTEFVVPPGCSVQTIQLVAAALERTEGVSGQVRSVGITPASASASKGTGG